MRGEHKLSGDEEDAYSKYWRKRYCYLQRAGVIKKIKRYSHKKDRAIGKKKTKET